LKPPSRHGKEKHDYPQEQIKGSKKCSPTDQAQRRRNRYWANFHLLAIPEDRAEENIKTFGPVTSDLHRLADWLTEDGIETVAMESTGV
jgi:hypothetical protein